MTTRGWAMAASATALGILLTACSGGGTSGSKASSAASGAASGAGNAAIGSSTIQPPPTGPGTPGTNGPGPALGQSVTPGQARIVRNGSMTIEVDQGHLQSAYDQAQTLAAGSGGFVATSNMATAEGAAPSASLTLRIPTDQLSVVITALTRLGTVQQQNLKGEDVTGQLVDLDARIKNLQAEEDALRTLVGRAQAVGDILQVQGQVFNVRQQIEQLGAQQSQLGNQATYATLAVQFVERGGAVQNPPKHGTRPRGTLSKALDLAGTNSLAILRGVLLTVGWLAPLLAVAAVAIPIFRRFRRRAGTQPD